MSSPTPYWRLLSVLFSSVQLSPALAMTLVEAARALHREGRGSQQVAGDLAQGRVDNLRKETLLGTIAGHLFEAKLDTPTGPGVVRFLLTQEGLQEDAGEESAPSQGRAALPRPGRPLPPRYLN
jgi:hypothetical protein